MTSIIPPVIAWDDSPRARGTDPAQSHKGADKSAGSRGRVKAAVKTLLSVAPATGVELNDRYREHQAAYGFPPVSFESPRKRAEELYADDEIRCLNPGTGEPRVYALLVEEVTA